MSAKDPTKFERRLTYSALSLTFVSVFTLFNLLRQRTHRELKLQPFELTMLGFATYRLGRMVAYDKVMETYRALFTRTVPDQSGAGESVEPRRGSGVQEAIGELLCCPICTGTWIAAGLVYALTLVPQPTRVFLSVMSTIGVAELLNAATEALSWFGQAARDEAGLIEEGVMPVAPLPKKRATPTRPRTRKRASPASTSGE